MKYLRSAMRKSRSRREKPPSLHVETTSRDPSPRCSTVLSDWDADDEGFMSSGEHLPSRPLSLAIPVGPYCPRRPTLREVLANSAPPPWTLSAFMAYLSQNHCLETLEFTMDASRYRKHYETLLASNPGTPITPATEGCEYVRMLWQKLLDAYITRNGPREVNLPSDVRDHLLSSPNQYTPPHPSELDTAVRIVYELMDESVLVPFLNSVSSARGPNSYTSPWMSNDDMSNMFSSDARGGRSMSPGRAMQRDHSPATSSASSRDTQYSGQPPRSSQHSHLTTALKRGRQAAHVSSSSSSTDAQDGALTDDSSTDSPSSLTEPMTPPMSDSFMSTAADLSPKVNRGDESSWKKMGLKLGLRRSRTGHQSDSSTTSGSYYSSSRGNDPREENIR